MPKKTIQLTLSWGKKELSHLENPSLESEVLLGEILKKERTYLKAFSEKEISEASFMTYKNFIQKRKQNIPTAYVLGYKIWHHQKTFVTPETLIPRDETEILMQHIKNYLNKNFDQNEKINFLDIGTGSGIMALWCKKNWPSSEVFATDISPEALKIARKNAKYQNLAIHFFLSDLLQNLIPQKTEENLNQEIKKNSNKNRIIMANLPYVPKKMKVEKDLSYEPQTALFSGEDGLQHIKKLIDQLVQYKIVFDSCWLEFLPQQKERIQNYCEQNYPNYFTLKFFPDLSGKIFFAKISPFPFDF